MQLETQLAERNVTFDLAPDAIAWLAERGYDERWCTAAGTRPSRKISRTARDEILFGKLKKGGVVKVDRCKGRRHRRGSCSKPCRKRLRSSPRPMVSRPARQGRETQEGCRKGKRSRYPKRAESQVEEDGRQVLEQERRFRRGSAQGADGFRRCRARITRSRLGRDSAGELPGTFL